MVHLSISYSNEAYSTVPHPLYSSPETRICLITADPPADSPKAYKNLISSSDFPADLAPKITRVVRFSKLSKKYRAYEARRALFAEFDVFLADQRIIHLVPAALGSVFYKSTTKRPIPVALTGKALWGQREKKDPLARLKPKRKVAGGGPVEIGSPADVGADIEKALSTLAINLSPSPSTSIKVAYTGWPAEWIAENVDAAVRRVVARYVPGGWKGVKAMHLKGPSTAALPIWMAEQLWRDESMVLDEGEKAVNVQFRKKSKEEKRRHRELRAAETQALEDVAPEAELPERVDKGKKRKVDDAANAGAEAKKAKKIKDKEASKAAKERRKQLKDAPNEDAEAEAEAAADKSM
jgi:ribosome biogenesis protein UTP30